MLGLSPTDGSEKSLRGSCTEHQTAVTLGLWCPWAPEHRAEQGQFFLEGPLVGNKLTGSQRLCAVNEDKTLNSKSHKSSTWKKQIINPCKLYKLSSEPTQTRWNDKSSSGAGPTELTTPSSALLECSCYSTSQVPQLLIYLPCSLNVFRAEKVFFTPPMFSTIHGAF